MMEGDVIGDTKRAVALIESPELLSQADRIASVRGRASRVSSLIRSCILSNSDTPSSSITVISPSPSSDLESFHSGRYVDFLRRLRDSKDPERLAEEEGEEFGMGYDCPTLDGLLDLCSILAGASEAAADAVASGKFDVAINWCGGWHHAGRDTAEGFCYVNDAVLCVHRIRRRELDRVLYVDMDVHHGDGVENAFAFSPKVFTLSLHLREAGFYPGTGDLEDCGLGRGRNYSLNVPLKEGIADDAYFDTFKRCLSRVTRWFRPDAVVCQCGADGMAGDPLGGFNLTPEGIVRCVEEVLSLSLPTVLLGGGGYDSRSAAILWTRLTAAAAGVRLDTEEVPDCDPYFPLYGPGFDLEVPRGTRRDANTGEQLRRIAMEVERRYGCAKEEEEAKLQPTQNS